ncbi:hypothetical protein TNCV_3386001 [Trichonephila clavipes]|nr:hypothetical protein TNCV_3386001 [Trichonephila clavipes]
MPLDNKCRIGPLAGAPPHVRWSSALRLNRDSSLKMTRVCHTPSCPRSAKSSRHFSGKRLSAPQANCRLLMVSLDGTGFWKEVSGVESMLYVSGHFLIARSSRSFVFLDVLTLRDGTLYFPLLPTPSNYHIAPTEVAADTSIRPTCFSEAYYTAPIKVRQLLVLPPVTS